MSTDFLPKVTQGTSGYTISGLTLDQLSLIASLVGQCVASDVTSGVLYSRLKPYADEFTFDDCFTEEPVAALVPVRRS